MLGAVVLVLFLIFISTGFSDIPPSYQLQQRQERSIEEGEVKIVMDESLGGFMKGTLFDKSFNLTFTKPIPLGDGKSNVTVRIKRNGEVVAESTKSLADLLIRKGMIGEDLKYTLKPIFFNYTVNVTARNITLAPIKFDFSVKRKVYRMKPPNYLIFERDNKWIFEKSLGCSCEDWRNEPVTGGCADKGFSKPISPKMNGNTFSWEKKKDTASRVYKFYTYVFLISRKTIAFKPKSVDDGVRIYLDGRLQTSLEEKCLGYEGCRSVGNNCPPATITFSPGWHKLEFWVYNRGKERNHVKLEISAVGENVENFANIFDKMKSTYPDNHYWNAEKVVVTKTNGERLSDYCSGPWDFERKPVTGLTCSGSKVNVRPSEVKQSEKPVISSSVLFIPPSCDDATSYHFFTWISTQKKLDVDLDILVNDGMSIYLDGERKITCMRTGEEEIGECTKSLVIPIGVHRLDIYLYNKDGSCYLNIIPLNREENFFHEMFTDMTPFEPTTEWVEQSGKNIELQRAEGLQEVVLPFYRHLEAKLYKDIEITSEGEYEIEVLPRVVCGNQEYEMCKKFNGGKCKTDSNGWIKGRVLDEGKTKSWRVADLDDDGNEDDVELYIELFDNSSLEENRDKYAGSAIGGIYKCRYGVERDYSYEGVPCEYQHYSHDVLWDGDKGKIIIYDYDVTATYIINYLPYAGGSGEVKNFTMFSELPKFCAYAVITSEGKEFSVVKNYTNKRCDPNNFDKCCVCTSEDKCLLGCVDDEGKTGGRFYLPFDKEGNDWFISTDSIKLTIKTTSNMVRIEYSPKSVDESIWSNGFTLTPHTISFEKILWEPYNVELSLSGDFGLRVPDWNISDSMVREVNRRPREYEVEVELSYLDENEHIERVTTSRNFYVYECAAVGRKWRNAIFGNHIAKERSEHFFPYVEVNGIRYEKVRVSDRTRCRLGTLTCSENRMWFYNRTDEMAVYPSEEEVCNGIDDDCNGWVDDIGGTANIFAEMVSYYNTYGRIKTPQEITRCGCFQSTKKSEEVCNGIDDDCDGIIDNNEKKIIINTCDEAVMKCLESGFSIPGMPKGEYCKRTYLQGNCKLITESIRGEKEVIVNECNDDVKKCMDTRYFNGNEYVNFTYEQCATIYLNYSCILERKIIKTLGDTCKCSLGGEKGKEVCNGIDDDCNGRVDDVEYPFSCACHGINNATLISMMKKSEEVCNGIDDNCNGMIDEGVANCACSGRSAEEVKQITSSAREICDGIDNDCDGLIDEDWPELGSNCGTGACANGVYVCNAYGDDVVCNTTVSAAEVFGINALNMKSEEICNMVDDDCDYAIDEECSCTPDGVAKKVCGYDGSLYYNSAEQINSVCEDVMDRIFSIVSWKDMPGVSKYRRAVTVENNNSIDLFNYPVMVMINTRELIANKKMREDGKDIRIVDDEGNEIPLTISEINSENTKIWFDVNIKAGERKVYKLYYGDLLSPKEPASSTAVLGVKNKNGMLLLCHFDATLLCSQTGKGNTIPMKSKSVSFLEGKYERGIKIDNGGMLSYPTSANFNKNKGTIELWVKMGEKESKQYIFYIPDLNGKEEFSAYVQDNKLHFVLVGKKERHEISTALRDGGWTHIAFVWDVLSGMKIFINGRQVADKEFSTAPVRIEDIGTDIYIGSDNESKHRLNGIIDELVIYSLPLAIEDIRMDMNFYALQIAVHREENITQTILHASKDVYVLCNQMLNNITQGIRNQTMVDSIKSMCDSILICNSTFNINPLSICKIGYQSCVDGKWDVCRDAVYPRTEICNGIDDDCNGIVDDGLTNCACTGKSAEEIARIKNQNEICNGIDDDCNGIIDDVGHGTSVEETRCATFNKIVNLTVLSRKKEPNICNGIDDNSNGIIDEDVENCACAFTTLSNISLSIKQELCNGIDDDCDGLIDEDWQANGRFATKGVYLGAPCGGPVGKSLCSGGRYVCSADGTSLVCSTKTSATNYMNKRSNTYYLRTNHSYEAISVMDMRSKEICNGIDDDCDARIDNILRSESSRFCQCTDGGIPQDEVCNGKDDDCNGIIDDGLTNCACTGLDFSEVARIKESAVEVCNNIDDDCNGIIDDGLTNCACTYGLLTNPSLQPEFCNGMDDDCNGIVDDVPVPELCACYNGTPPKKELCNGIDDDCDGLIDEDWPELGSNCGSGVCSGGVYECKKDGSESVCSTISGTEDKRSDDGPGHCDNIDNDCDGVVDEGCSCSTGDKRECGTDVGACKKGYQLCINGVWGPCLDAVTPKIEICNGIDDDCDGIIDNIGGKNSVEETKCACYNMERARGVMVEVCNGIDDDCDGIIDNIGGKNSVEETKCACYNGTPPKKELCNGIDDDCDGLIDEDWPELGSNCGTGICSGRYVCWNGEIKCNGASPQKEICDNIDNDCDGLVDEGCEKGKEIVNLASTCENGIMDGDEEGIDCGGSCGNPCEKPSPKLKVDNTWVITFVAFLTVLISVGVILSLK